MLFQIIDRDTIRPCCIIAEVDGMPYSGVDNCLEICRVRKDLFLGSCEQSFTISITNSEVKLAADDLITVSFFSFKAWGSNPTITGPV